MNGVYVLSLCLYVFYRNILFLERQGLGSVMGVQKVSIDIIHLLFDFFFLIFFLHLFFRLCA